MSAQSRATASRLLVHYFQVLFRKTGTPWQADYQVELEEVLTAVFDEIDGLARELDEQVARVQHQIDVPDWRDRR